MKRKAVPLSSVIPHKSVFSNANFSIAYTHRIIKIHVAKHLRFVITILHRRFHYDSIQIRKISWYFMKPTKLKSFLQSQCFKINLWQAVWKTCLIINRNVLSHGSLKKLHLIFFYHWLNTEGKIHTWLGQYCKYPN